MVKIIRWDITKPNSVTNQYYVVNTLNQQPLAHGDQVQFFHQKWVV
jgi:hypothetical protein